MAKAKEASSSAYYFPAAIKTSSVTPQCVLI